MNNLDITKFGLQPLKCNELLEIDGGFILASITAILVGGFIFETINNYDKMVEVANEGYRDGKNATKR
ncbi:hypothetical protein ORI89_16175 [Sphingobacterium sp. UT-1RO-CII-1]|uniref:hypothetical protein n=1 Tax=Sphingobacterium sp. UT-1RO-CII-1 TaxID=2995225 RepID=UPI00227B7D2A|nr:hypothetical protein [Sphingobacterium sp. UT-1RO-CII-1]MCY4781200.1 hypothetical protein [Sphingobacterium sp. UT-1RO-CII-1]